MGFKQSAGDALVHSSTVSALKVQVRKTKAQQCAHHGVGPFVPEEATLGVAPNLPSGPVGRLEDRHVHAGLPQPVRSREPTVQRQNAISSNTSQAPHTEAHTHSQNQKPRKQSSRRRPHSQILRDTPGERPLSPDAGAHDGDRPGGGRAAVVRARHGEHGAEATAGLAGARGCGAIRMG
jgi:hypothetical protein